jgi:hypothetical protein
MNRTLSDWNYAFICLVQATIGSISNNFRMIGLELRGDTWVLHFWLGEESAEDREEIDDIKFEFENFAGDVRAEVIVDVTKADLQLPELPSRVTYRKREH